MSVYTETGMPEIRPENLTIKDMIDDIEREVAMIGTPNYSIDASAKLAALGRIADLRQSMGFSR
jgi:hypothetical protein